MSVGKKPKQLVVDEFIGKVRSAAEFAALRKRLMSESEEERFRFIQEFLAREPSTGLSLANSVLKSHKFIKTILNDGLDKADVSSVKYWLDLGIQRLGAARVIEMLDARLATDPVSVKRALYWLARLVPKNNERVVASLRSLIDAVDRIDRSYH